MKSWQRERAMRKAKRLWIEWKGILGLVGLVILLAPVLTGCTLEMPAIAAVEPTATLYPPPPTDIPLPPPGPRAEHELTGDKT